MDVKHLAKCGVKFLKDKRYRFRILAGMGFYDFMPDREYLEKLYDAVLGSKPDLDNPTLFNEKMNWLKMHDRKPIYTVMSDKNLAKSFIAEKLGEEYVIPTYGVWDDPDKIDFDSLPEQFVLKCNHNSGEGMYICRNKAEMNVKKVKRGLRKALKENYYFKSREWQYKDIPRKIIAEKLMQDEVQNEKTGLYDYKFFCFNGKPEFLYVSSGGKGHAIRVSFVDTDWKQMPVMRSDHKPLEKLPPKPDRFDEMLEIAAEMSKGIPFLRVDLYEIGGRIYFSEFTFRNCGGFTPLKPDEWNKKFGDMLKLPE